MRNAPSVRYPVGRSALHATLVGLLSFAGALALLLPALVYPAVPGWLWGAGVVLWSGWSVCAGVAWWHTPQGQLQWDAHAMPVAGFSAGVWRWMPDGGSVVELQSLDWTWDVQHQLLLRLNAPGHRLPWLWLERRQDPLRWDDLRRALTAHARPRAAS